MVLEDGTVPTDRGELHVDCTAYGFRVAPARPIFEPGRITPQSLMGGFIPFNAALVGFIESVRDDDAEKNRLCHPVSLPSRPVDLVSSSCGFLRYFATHSAEPDLLEWSARSRLAVTRGLTDHVDDPRMQSAVARWAANLEPAMENGEQLMADSASSSRHSTANRRQPA
jgi:hypothetical protein